MKDLIRIKIHDLLTKINQEDATGILSLTQAIDILVDVLLRIKAAEKG